MAIRRVVSACVSACVFALAAVACAAGECQLMVISRPSGAVVFIDGEERGETTLSIMDMPTGTHEIRLFLAGHVGWMKQVKLRPGVNSVEATLVKEGEPVAAVPAPSPEVSPPAAPGSPPAPAPAVNPPSAAKEVVPRTVDVPCLPCKGTGLIKEMGCYACRSDGYAGQNQCPDCGATARRPYACPACAGKGKVTGPQGEADCRFCAGKGYPPCMICRGTGKLQRPNPALAGFPTVQCASCSGSGFEQMERCGKCAGKGQIGISSGFSSTIYSTSFRYLATCPICMGTTRGPRTCPQCSGRGYVGMGAAAVPCRGCSGTKLLYAPCRTCGGAGWHRAN